MDKMILSSGDTQIRLLDGTVNLFKFSRGCGDFYCGDKKWKALKAENGCQIILEMNVNGNIEIVPMYFVDLEDGVQSR